MLSVYLPTADTKREGRKGGGLRLRWVVHWERASTTDKTANSLNNDHNKRNHNHVANNA